MIIYKKSQSCHASVGLEREKTTGLTFNQQKVPK